MKQNRLLAIAMAGAVLTGTFAVPKPVSADEIRRVKAGELDLTIKLQVESADVSGADASHMIQQKQISVYSDIMAIQRRI